MLAVVIRTMEFVVLCGVAIARLGDRVHGSQADRRRRMVVEEKLPPAAVKTEFAAFQFWKDGWAFRSNIVADEG